VTARAVAGADLQVIGVIFLADNNAARSERRLVLRVASQTEVYIAFNQQFVIDRPVGRVTGDAALAHGGVLEYKRP
jgi:hypothetical protein